jgi:diaminohydroxyphosphoribosylaminopyrimidine deaminase/5-amino-6-(5-phosphoribosylamino)uracil reductase
VAGKGVRVLRKAGIVTDVGLCAAEAQNLAAPYLKHRRSGRPWVILKWAQSIDGKIADRDGKSQWISGAAARRLTHRWRGEVDAIIVGVETALRDDPQLTARASRPKRIATRVVLDAKLRLPARSKLVRTAKRTPLLIATARNAGRGHASKRRRLESAGAEILPLPARAGRVDLAKLLDELGRRNLLNVLVEGGGRVFGEFFDAGLADECRIFVSPRLLGGDTALSALPGHGKKLAGLPDATVGKVGEDQLLIVRL